MLRPFKQLFLSSILVAVFQTGSSKQKFDKESFIKAIQAELGVTPFLFALAEGITVSWFNYGYHKLPPILK